MVEVKSGPCQFCRKEGAQLRCTHCKAVVYCNQECQRADWKVHKRSFEALPPVVQKPTRSVPVIGTPLCGAGFRRWLDSQGTLPTGPASMSTPSVGLQNQANICYLNAVLQCLVHTPLLRAMLERAYRRPRKPEEWLEELLSFFDEVDRADGSGRSVGAYRLATLISSNKEFARGRQADAHEAFIFIINQLMDSCLAVGDGSGVPLSERSHGEKVRLERSSLVGQVFGVDFGQTVRCKHCSYSSTSSKMENCLQLSCTLGLSPMQLQVLQREAEEMQARHFSSMYSLSRSSAVPADSAAPETSLTKLLEELTKSEFIDSFRCEKCKMLGCSRTENITGRPNVLTIYIQRRQDSGMFSKVKRRVLFPQRLDLSPFLNSTGNQYRFGPPENYTLYALVVHKDVNRSTFFGHYVAYVRDRQGRWYLLDDSKVEPVTWGEVQVQHADLLFYAADQVQFLGEEADLSPSAKSLSTATPPSSLTPPSSWAASLPESDEALGTPKVLSTTSSVVAEPPLAQDDNNYPQAFVSKNQPNGSALKTFAGGGTAELNGTHHAKPQPVTEEEPHASSSQAEAPSDSADQPDEPPPLEDHEVKDQADDPPTLENHEVKAKVKDHLHDPPLENPEVKVEVKAPSTSFFDWDDLPDMDDG